MPKILALLALMAGCAPIIKQMRGNDLPNEIAAYTQITQSAFEFATGFEAPSVPVAFDFRGSAIASDLCPENGCHGLLRRPEREGGPWIVLLYGQHECLPLTSMAHELLHIYSDLVFKDIDKEHSNRELFYAKGSAEYLARLAGVGEGLCE